jgi:hypothetical protein
VQSLVRHIVMNILSSFLLCSMRGHEMSRQSISWRLWNQSALNAADVVSLRPCSARKASHFEWKHALKSSILVLNYIRSKIAIYERRSNIPPISQKTSGICSRVMKQLQVYLVLTLFHAFYGTMTGNSPSVAASMQSLVDVHDRNKSHDVTTPDPVGVKSPPEQRKVKTVSVDDRVLPRPSFGRKPVVAKCSPQPYRVRLRNGSCSRAVLTKVPFDTDRKWPIAVLVFACIDVLWGMQESYSPSQVHFQCSRSRTEEKGWNFMQLLFCCSSVHKTSHCNLFRWC